MQPRTKEIWKIVSAAAFVLVYFIVYRAAASLAERYHLTYSWDTVAIMSLPFLAAAAIVIAAAASMKNGPDRSKRPVVALIALLVALMTYAYTPFHVMNGNERDTRFEYNRWVSKPASRAMMVDDLLRRHQLEGLRRMEVVDLLGAPSFPEDYREGPTFIYQLGWNPGGENGLSGMRLTLSLDGNDQVESFTLTNTP